MEEKNFSLNNLEVFQLAKKISEIVWLIYEKFDWKIKKIIGDQFIESTDSIGANISEGYGRFHYLDRIKFLYNARGSLFESKYWFDLLINRKILNDLNFINKYLEIYNKLFPKLNGLIKSLYKNKKNLPNTQ